MLLLLSLIVGFSNLNNNALSGNVTDLLVALAQRGQIRNLYDFILLINCCVDLICSNLGNNRLIGHVPTQVDVGFALVEL